MKAIDFFCGAGGLTRGLLDAGIAVTDGFDIDVRCRHAYEHNNMGARFHHVDIGDLDVRRLRAACRLRSFDDVLFAGCAPCQPFSPLRKGTTRGRSATLLAEFGRVVAAVRPGYVLVENVPGIARVRGFSTFKRFVRLLIKAGYQVAYGVLDAKYYGVPQSRRRLLLLASRYGKVVLPPPRFGVGRRPLHTVRDAIGRFPPIRAGEQHPSVPNHVSGALSPINLARLQATPHDGGDRRNWPPSLILKCHQGDHAGYGDTYGRMYWDRPSPTLTGRCRSITNGRFGHPDQDRAISLREAAAIQSFPDGYEFFGTNNTIAQQIGNAVPPRLAEFIGMHILALRDRYNADSLGRSRASRGDRSRFAPVDL